ncbi:circadian locomoter output cycles protein kaput isoform X3 [Syngnathus typhle]|uniref:circadian locomoter output cycles protein kaput isoform X3 n=1 Tax=Syngnathus typhle TaxID=161592 RepID=UPI002A6AC452|nr:circadian locomoter output cycles protein kaput isoform X3 [Syngnathus typhle]
MITLKRIKMTTSIDQDDGSIFGLMDDDEKDKAKRVSRNKSEKKRRDHFNILIKELGTMLPGNTRKMDKSTILQKSIDFLQKQQEICAESESTEIRQDWKPPFLSNEEFTQLMLEALDGFFLAITADGNIIYASESVTSLLEHLPCDLVDQNLLNFLPRREHSDVYKLLSSHVAEGETLTPEYLKTKNQLEFCCHMLRGTMDPEEPPVYEYVKFIGNFKSLNNVPHCTPNGFTGTVVQRSLHSSFEEQLCLVATVRLAKPKFIKEMCTVEEPNEEFTSRHSLEWKFLFLDHRAPPIIGYLPFEVLGTSGYDYYHVDDLDTLAKCHEQLMQYGKGKSCYYRFLTKGQQWIWLQTHYYITYHQWNSRPEFIVCTHTVVSYGEVRTEQRRESGLRTSTPEMAADKQTHDSDVESQHNGSDLQEALESLDDRMTPSASLRSLRKSLHAAPSEASSSQAKLQGGQNVPRHQLASNASAAAQRRLSVGSQSVSSQSTVQTASMVSQQVQTDTQASSAPFSDQLDNMQHVKNQLEQRTHAIESSIQRQLDELCKIQQELQRVQEQSLQMFVQNGAVNMAAVQMAPRAPSVLTMQGQVVSAGPLQTSIQHHAIQAQQNTAVAQPPPAASLYNTLMIPQQNAANVLQIASNLPPNTGTTTPNITFTQDRTAQIRFPAARQLLTKLVTGQMACGAVMVPSTMFMGQVVTAFAPQPGPTQTISIAQQPAQQQQQQEQQAQRLIHGSQLILPAGAFSLQQAGAFAATAAANQQKHQSHTHRMDN